MDGIVAWDHLRPMEHGNDEFEIYHVSTPKHTQPWFHTHDFYEIFFLLDGDIQVFLEEYVFSPSPGTMIIFPPGHMHRAITTDANTHYERMYIYISRDCLEQMGIEDFSLLQILDQCARYRQFVHSIDSALFAKCRDTFFEVIESAAHGPDAHEKLIDRCKVTMVLTSLCKAFREKQDQCVARPAHRMAKLITYINEHLTEDLSLDHLENTFFISKFHMLREFKNHTNKTVHQYILSKRVILAKHLMQTGHCPTDVATRCGFKEYSGFYRAFKKEAKLTPQEFYSGMERRPLTFGNQDR